MKDQGLREHLTFLLEGGGAHLSFQDAFAHLPPQLWGKHVKGVPHTAWRLLEHMRICQWDILEFSRNPNYESPVFPEGYWPQSDAPEDANAWEKSIARFQSDLQEMIDLVNDPGTDLLAPIRHGQGQTILREALLVADHNSYHIGQVVLLRRCLGAWDD